MKRTIAIILSLCLLIGAGWSIAVGGSSSDPLISLSFIKDIFSPSAVSDGEAHMNEALQKTRDEALSGVTAVVTGVLGSLPGEGYSFSSTYTNMTLRKGYELLCLSGASVVVSDGAVSVTVQKGALIDVTAGREVFSGSQLTVGRRYFTVEDTVVSYAVVSDTAGVGVSGSYKVQSPYGELFSDVPMEHWAADAIYSLTGMKLFTGTSSALFSPNASMTRGMFVTVVGRLHNAPTAGYTQSGFSDVSLDEWYGSFVAWAGETGVVNGIGDGKFGPNVAVTREQMCAMLYRYMQFSGIILPKVNESALFSDSSDISDWAYEAVSLCQQFGLVNGKAGNRFDPKGLSTRAEVATILYRLINAM